MKFALSRPIPVTGSSSSWTPARLDFVSGWTRVVMAESGEEMEYGPGDVAVMASDHDAWIVGEGA